jgi:hypothetical protein
MGAVRGAVLGAVLDAELGAELDAELEAELEVALVAAYSRGTMVSRSKRLPAKRKHLAAARLESW